MGSCLTCLGSGEQYCDLCDGKGSTGGWLGLFSTPCAACAGTGKTECEECSPSAQDEGGREAASVPDVPVVGAFEMDTAVSEFLRDVGSDEDGLLIHGLGRDIDLIPPNLVRASEILGSHFQTTGGLRLFLSHVIADDSSTARVHGAIKILKKVGAGEPEAGDYSGLLVEPLLAVLHRPPLDDDLYSDALMLLNYCDATSPVTLSDQQRIAERAQSNEAESLTKFSSLARLLETRWSEKEATSTDAGPYKVWTNGQGLYQILESDLPAPEGYGTWQAMDKTGTEEECEAFMHEQIAEDVKRQRGF